MEQNIPLEHLKTLLNVLTAEEVIKPATKDIILKQMEQATVISANNHREAFQKLIEKLEYQKSTVISSPLYRFVETAEMHFNVDRYEYDIQVIRKMK